MELNGRISPQSLQHVVPAYSVTAEMYDRLVGIYAFEQWRENFERLRKRYDLDISRAADVACGTGLAACFLAEVGSNVLACDISVEMLRAAAATTYGRNVRLIRQDMRYLSLPRRSSLLISVSDSLNHLLRDDDIRRAFRSFHAALLPGGHALFDMNSLWQLRGGADAEPWDFEVDGRSMLWISEWDEGSRIATLKLIMPGAPDEGGEQAVEVHREKAYELEWLVAELREAGFRGVEVLDAAGLGRVTEKTRRLQFMARA